MPAYLVVDVRYDDLGWTEAYRRDVPPMIKAWGGRYLAKAVPPERLEGEGERPDTLAILEFPSAESVRRFLASAEYAPYAAERRAGSRTVIYLLEG
ncbi:DUF1330 domain-containing protein (plasmid) [Sphingobium sp. SJ10-10]|uniref:DUF1330 domain-containing protein n=1 Tax=Sphingobium sp. SJ10-10 TaxID=3114999 RepID=UPI002E170E99|nr:DUF1330 domain-containing protein [Sphingobium sp. SJ10-10]